MVLTHDRDFGRLAIAQGAPFRGIVYLRPGHIDPDRVVAMFSTLASIDADWERPFVLVAEARDRVIRIRLRQGPP